MNYITELHETMRIKLVTDNVQWSLRTVYSWDCVIIDTVSSPRLCHQWNCVLTEAVSSRLYHHRHYVITEIACVITEIMSLQRLCQQLPLRLCHPWDCHHRHNVTNWNCVPLRLCHHWDHVFIETVSSLRICYHLDCENYRILMHW